MEYYIIDKVELVDSVVEHTPIGYTTNSEVSEYIYNNYEVVFSNWIKDNKENLENGSISISIFFDNISLIYTSSQQTNSIEGMELNEINIIDL